MGFIKYLALGIFLVFFAAFISAADYSCTFDNTIAHVNCNAVGAASSFCYLAGPGAVANNPAVSTTCNNQTVICTLKNYSGSTSSIRCSNTPSYRSGPTLVSGTGSGTSGSCPYNDCELNQISCASGYAYQQCKPDPNDSRCNTWVANNCVANAPCYSTTPAQLATCMGIKAEEIQSTGGVYFRTSSASPPTSTPPSQPSGNQTAPPSGSAQLPSYTYNGKTYYIVSADNPGRNTGKEVCASVGKTCVGYTVFTNDVCKYFHPSASATTSVNGSKAGFYCNGPPQTGLACGSSYNNCQVCPACNVNVTCDEEIGGLFREMYVECSGSGPAGNGDLSQQISGMAAIIGDGKINVEYENTTYAVTIKNNQIVEAKSGVLYPDAKGTLKVSTSAINAIVAAQDKVKEAKNQFNNGGIQYIPNDIIETIKFFFIKLFAGFS